MIWLPDYTPHDIVKVLTIEDTTSSVYSAAYVLDGQQEIKEKWAPGQLARYGLILLKTLEGAGYTKASTTKPVFLRALKGSADWVVPRWLTPTVVNHHRAMLKWIDILRHLKHRCEVVTGDNYGSWRFTYDLPYILELTPQQVETAHKFLDNVNPDRMEFMLHYQDWDVGFESMAADPVDEFVAAKSKRAPSQEKNLRAIPGRKK